MKFQEDLSEFWDDLYVNGSAGWDLGGVTPVFEQLAGELKPGRLCILGCGRGYDAIMFAKKGFQVTAVDFSPEAVREVRNLAAGENISIDVLEADIFSLVPEFMDTFDYVVEQTCFCAINPARRAEYEALVRQLLIDGGQLVGLWFPLDKNIEDGGPPHGTGIDEVKALFSKGWSVLKEEYPALSIEPRKGREYLIIFQKDRI